MAELHDSIEKLRSEGSCDPAELRRLQLELQHCNQIHAELSSQAKDKGMVLTVFRFFEIFSLSVLR